MSQATGAPAEVRWRRHLLPAVAVLAVTGVFFWPFLLGGEHAVPFHFEWGSVTGIPNGGEARAVSAPLRWGANDSSPLLVHYPAAVLAARSLRGGELPLWNPYVGCGVPFLASGHVYPFSPFLAPFYARPSPWLFTLGLLLGTLWSALGFYLWSGRFIKEPWARGFGAAVWAINPWTVRLLLFADLWPNWWIGWLLWAWDGSVERGRRAWWLPALMAAGATFSGHPEVALLVVAASALYAWVAWLCTERDRRAPRFLLRFLGVCLLTQLLTAIHWLPVASRLGETVSYKMWLPEVALKQHYGFSSFLNPISDVYVNPLLWGLGLAGLWWARKDRRLWPLAAVLLLSVVMMTRLVPGEVFSRIVTIGGLLCSWYGRGPFWFAAVSLAAVGVSKLAAPEGGGQSLRWLWISGGFLPTVLFAGAEFVAGLGGDRLIGLGWVALYGILGIGLAVSLRWLPPRLQAAGISACLMALALDPYVFLRSGLKTEDPFRLSLKAAREVSFFNASDPLSGGPPAIADIRNVLGDSHGRFWAATDPPGAPVSCLSPNLADLWEVKDVRLLDVLMGERYLRLHESLKSGPPTVLYTTLAFPTASPSQLGLLGVQTCGWPLDRNGGGFKWEPVKNPLPRAYLVHEIIPTEDEDASVKAWRSLLPTERLHTEVILEGWKGPQRMGEPGSAGEIEWLEDGLDRVRLQVRTESEAVLVLLDSFSEGWTVKVDGRSAPLYPANLAFRGTVVPAGSHEVSFEYTPAAVRWGKLMTAAGILVLAAFCLIHAAAGRRDAAPS